uniref:Tetratricopeptide repeat domain 32 n=1 Tax=Cyprinus carpio TaxID=7962 RepID=A0A8C2CU42_CYPCA
MILQKAHDEFNSKNYKRAEELYTHNSLSLIMFPLINHILCLSRDCSADLAIPYNNRGQVKCLRVDFCEAMDDYTSALQIHMCVCFFVFFSSQGFFKEAESDFQTALELNPNFKDAKESLSQTLLDSEENVKRGC